MIEGQELVEATGTEIQPFNEFEVRFAEIKKHIGEKSYDLTTEQGIEEAEGDKTLIRKIEIGIEKERKSRGAGYLKATKDLNASAKVCHAMVHELWEVIDKPLQVLRQIALDEAMDKLEAEKAEEKKIQDAKDAELEKLRAIVAKQEAKVQAEFDAARIEAGKLSAVKDALAKSEKEKQDAIALVKQKAHDEKNALIAKQLEEKNAADQKALDILAEKKYFDDQEAAKEEARKADTEHRKSFNIAAVNALKDIVGDSKVAESVVIAIVKGNVPNVKMNY